jgi:hypothetical protein
VEPLKEVKLFYVYLVLSETTNGLLDINHKWRHNQYDEVILSPSYRYMMTQRKALSLCQWTVGLILIHSFMDE